MKALLHSQNFMLNKVDVLLFDSVFRHTAYINRINRRLRFRGNVGMLERTPFLFPSLNSGIGKR